MELKLCSKEIAIQLKELDFNWDCDHYYENDNLFYFGDIVIPNELITLAPEQALIIKWLRDIHEIYIIPYPYKKENDTKIYCTYDILHNDFEEEEWEEDYNTYELAEEAGILKAIEILKTKQL